MNANDVEMVRVYVRQYQGPDDVEVADVTFAHNEQFVICVEAEAGTAKLNAGGPFRIDMTVRDLTHSTTNPLHHFVVGQLGVNWPVTEQKKLFQSDPIPCKHLWNSASDYSDCYEVLAVLTTGVGNPDVSFAKSPMFCCHKA